MEIKDSDIAIVEVLHDCLLDNHGYSLGSNMLKNARELIGRMYSAVSMQKEMKVDLLINVDEEISPERKKILDNLKTLSESIFGKHYDIIKTKWKNE